MTNRSPHRRDDIVRSVPDRGDGADNGDPAFPGQRAPAIGAEVALPSLIVNFPECGQETGSRVPVHREDGREGALLDEKKQPADGTVIVCALDIQALLENSATQLGVSTGRRRRRAPARVDRAA
jgi:hypothetical protein